MPGCNPGVTYTPLLEAAEELARRRALGFDKEVEAWWREKGYSRPPILEGLNGHKVAILERPVATGNYESAAFVLMAKAMELNPAWVELGKDKFCEQNAYKRSLITPHFCGGRGRANGLRIRKEVLISEGEARGRKLVEIILKDGMRLVERHHRHLRKVVGKRRRADCSDCLLGVSQTPRGFYPFKLSWAVAHMVLVENYDVDESGKDISSFRNSVTIPAIKEIETVFGVKPIIVKIPYFEEELFLPEDIAWLDHRVVPDEAELIRLCS